MDILSDTQQTVIVLIVPTSFAIVPPITDTG